VFICVGHREAQWPWRSVPWTGNDSGSGDAQLLLLLRSVRDGPGGIETCRSNTCRLWAIGNHGGRGCGWCAAVDGHIPGRRGQISDTARWYDAHTWLDHVHVARISKRGRSCTVQRTGTDARQMHSIVSRVVPRLRVHQKAVWHLWEEWWVTSKNYPERSTERTYCWEWVLELIELSYISNFQEFEKFEIRLKLLFEIEYFEVKHFKQMWYQYYSKCINIIIPTHFLRIKLCTY